MKQTVTETDFMDQFKAIRPDNFTNDGLRALYSYLEELEYSCDLEIEFDVIGICCDFYEDTLENVLKEYELDSIDDLRDSTCVIDLFNGRVVYGAF